MSPSVAVQLRTEQPALPAHGFAFGASANGNAKKKPQKLRRKQVRLPLPPRDVRNLAQCIQAADEAWQDLWNANLSRSERLDQTDDATILVAFSRIIHAMIDDRELCGLLLHYFDEKLQSEFADRQGPVKL
jgi:hypothetical protein